RRIQVKSRVRSFWGSAGGVPVASGGEIEQGFGDRAAQDRQLSTRWHRFNGVQDDIGQAAVELFNVGEEWRQSGSPISLELNALLLRTLAVNLDHALQEGGQGNWGTLQARWPRQ